MYQIYSSHLFHIISEENIRYILRNAHILPLVLANNKNNFKTCGANVYFNCPFHEEKTPSFRIETISNLGYCFGCGQKVNSFTYLERYEHLKFKNAILLLAQIYLFDIKIEPKMNAMVQKYQEAIIGPKYEEILKNLQKTANDDNVFDEMLATRERIKRQEYDKEFVYEEPKRILYLK